MVMFAAFVTARARAFYIAWRRFIGWYTCSGKDSWISL